MALEYSGCKIALLNNIFYSNLYYLSIKVILFFFTAIKNNQGYYLCTRNFKSCNPQTSNQLKKFEAHVKICQTNIVQ